ncbi:MAG: hypothetical protein FWD70_00330 [Desulfuromonadales bacterium]|nr:hypothetical protein [Desulfuromonadales bacterium]
MRKLIILILIVIVICAACFFGWPLIRTLFFGGRISYANSPKGQWVGELEISRDYSPIIAGAVLSHKKAAIHFDLSVQDTFMDKYQGDGELYLQGDSAPRRIHIGSFSVDAVPTLDDNGQIIKSQVQRLSAVLHIFNKPKSADEYYDINGHFTPQEMIFKPEWSSDLTLSGKLHRGTEQDFNQIRQQLTTETKNQQR